MATSKINWLLKNFSPEIRAKVAMTYLNNSQTLERLSQVHDVEAKHIQQWAEKLKAKAAVVLSAEASNKRIDVCKMSAQHCHYRMIFRESWLRTPPTKLYGLRL